MTAVLYLAPFAVVAIALFVYARWLYRTAETREAMTSMAEFVPEACDVAETERDLGVTS